MDAQFWNGKRAPGVPDTVDASAYASIIDLVETCFEKYADKPAFTGIGHTLCYRDIDRLSTQFACYLQHQTDLRPGDRIAIQMPNLLQFPVAVYGALKAGLVVVNTNPLYTAREMRHQFVDSGARALVFLDVFGHLVEEVASDTALEYLIVTSAGDCLPAPRRQLVNLAARYLKKMVRPFRLAGAVSLRKVLKQGGRQSYSRPDSIKLDDLAVLQYTGGTTGVSKGAMLTHRNLVANMLQARGHLSQTDASGQLVHKPGQIIVAPLPLYHIYAFTVHLLVMMEEGSHNILIANPRDTAGFIKTIKPWRFTAFVGLNTLFASLLNRPDFRDCDFSRLKLTLSGGTALQADTAAHWQRVTGSVVSEAYGLTECSPAVAINPLQDWVRPGTVGVPVPGTALKTVDQQGQETPPGEPGELCVKGPQVMTGYWQSPQETAEVLDADGWFRTGDVAVIGEDGFVTVVDRIKDMVLVSGFNVYPNEVETVVSTLEGVAHCAAVGVRDEKTGESVKLFVVPSDKNLTAEEVRAHCQRQLTAYKVPRYIELRDELPMTPVGKVLRRALREA